MAPSKFSLLDSKTTPINMDMGFKHVQLKNVGRLISAYINPHQNVVVIYYVSITVCGGVLSSIVCIALSLEI